MPEPPTPPPEPVEAAGAVHLCLLLGRMLFHFGATTQRIQDSIACLARFLGCKVEVLVSYDALMITVHDGPTFRTRIDSSRGVAGLNLLGLVRVSQLVRGLPGSRSNTEEVEKALCEIRDAPLVQSVAVQAFAAGCAGASFCMVNGGDPASWICSFLVAAFIFGIRRRLTALNFNVQMTFFVIAFAGSLLAGLLALLTQTATPAIALVAPCLFLVPGVPMINGGVDVVRNHVTMGIARVGFTLAILLALSLGIGLTVPLFPLRIGATFSLPGAWEIALNSGAGALAAGALACLNNGGLPFMALCAIGGLIGRLIRALMIVAGLDLIDASLLGALCSTLLVIFIADRRRWPAVPASVMAVLPMVPGYFAITGLHALLSFASSKTADPAQLAGALHALALAHFISIALVVGVIGPVILLQRERERV